jgi:hypothetical protein
MPEILDITELAAPLKCSRGQCYELCRDRERLGMAHPLSMIKINGNIRFDKTALTEWLNQLQENV